MSSRRGAASNGSRQKVGIAEYAVVTDETVLMTSGLGSCLGIVIQDPENEVSGLIHIMLPQAANGRDSSPEKFVDTGLPTLIEAMERYGAQRDAMRAWIVGGSEMLKFTTGSESIGSRNVEAAKQLFSSLDIPIVGTDVGGDHGRSIRFDPDEGTLVIKTADETRCTL